MCGSWDGWDIKTLKMVMDQDYFHVARKLLNGTQHASRLIYWGTAGVVLLSMLANVFDRGGFDGCGFHQSDLDRSGYRAMDWASFERVVAPQSLSFMDDCSRSGMPYLKPVIRFFALMRRYASIFLSKRLTYKQRAAHAAYCVTTLRLQRQWVVHNPLLNTRDHCPTREAFQDCLLSCHFAVLMMKMFGEHYPHLLPPPIHKLGSNCCEDFFSALGSFVANKRVFTYMEALTTTRAKLRVLMQEAAGGFAAPPIKSRNSSSMKDDMNDELGPKPYLPGDTNWGPYLPGDMARGWRAGVGVQRRYCGWYAAQRPQ